MPVQSITLTLPSGTTVNVPAIQFQMDNTKQIAVLGITSELELSGFALITDKKTETSFQGKLNELELGLRDMLIRSLNFEGWNFLRYSNPHIFLLTLKQ